MKMEWTDQQKKVINLHNRNLLVAAAAGSGKTAVLVERVIQMITRKDNPVDIDKLLVVTFTNAAAAEMRQRIGAALEKALKDDPDNVHLQTQVTLLHNAQISTIHSFGLHVIRNHFYQIDLDPAFRIGDEREIAMLKEDVLAKVMENAYAQSTSAFLDFVRAYGNSKNDKNICEMILKFHNYADSYPWPKEWILDCEKLYQCSSVEELDQQAWVMDLMDYIKGLIAGLEKRIHFGMDLALLANGPDSFAKTFELDMAILEQIKDCETYSQCYQVMQDISFSRAPSKKKTWDPDLFEKVKSIRNEVKDQIKKIKDSYFVYSPQEQVDMLVDERPMMEVLVGLTTDFMDGFAQAKEDKNIIDFGDIEHLTLKILVDEETKEPTATAREYQEQFVEVMVDEYQDSNYVQEALLCAVSRQSVGENNMFMVGDVKQSIYRFRLARPELFMEKYRTYQTEDAPSQRIDLQNNFRSRREVLDFTNEIFFHIMDEDMGNIVYNDEAALNPSRKEEKEYKPSTFMPEVLMINGDDEQVKDELALDKVAFEARVVATKIRQMTDPATAGEFCPDYKDIVILVHAMKGWSDVFVKVFAEEGIPLISSSRSGYFSAIEVQTIIQLLKILNNPRQDIPLAGVLKSPIGGLTDIELAQIKAVFPEKCFYEAVFSWQNLQGEEAAAIVQEKIADADQVVQIYDKITAFFAFLNQTRQEIADTPIHELIQNIYEQTGYLDYVTALPGGERRRANLDMLVELAISYESTSYQGLFDFVRYIEKMIRFELDYGEAELVSEQENAVRMMTIHKSKGLEFPVVFLCGMGKEFNMMSLNDALIFHPQYGVGLRWMGKERRVKKNTLARQVFGLLEKRELLGEEQRLLYVALTRAREKLILTGVAKKIDEHSGQMLGEREVLTFAKRMEAKTYWDWVLPAIYGGNISCRMETIGTDYVENSHVRHQIARTQQKARLLEAVEQVDEAASQQVAEILNWKYPHAAATAQKQKVSVSEMKHRYMEQQDLEDAVFLHKEQTVVPYLPRFANRVDEENAGALRGTAMHRYLECFDFAQRAGVDDGAVADLIALQLADMSQSGRLSDDLRQRLNLRQIEAFLLTKEAKQMAQAAANDSLYREKPFVMSLPASEVWEEASSEESVLIQGIVDVFWLDKEGITLLDYKTDAVKEPEELVRRYKLQLQLYAEALSRVFDNCPIKDILIYSFRLETVISLLDADVT